MKKKKKGETGLKYFGVRLWILSKKYIDHITPKGNCLLVDTIGLPSHAVKTVEYALSSA